MSWEQKSCPCCGAELCPICNVNVADNKHHLHPKSQWKTRTSGWRPETVKLCRSCHQRIHQLATDSELAKWHKSVERLIKLVKKADVV